MNGVNTRDYIIDRDDRILITGANGFIGSKVVEALLRYGFTNLRCFCRPSANLSSLEAVIDAFRDRHVELIRGNLLSRHDCEKATEGVGVLYHLAAGMEKTFAGCFMNSVVTTRNLLDSVCITKTLKRFVNVSSFAVYSNVNIKRGGVLDESCNIETRFMERSDAYCFGKAKQDELVIAYGQKHDVPYVILRPGAVYGPGVKQLITPRVGIDTFGIFLHLGGSNRVPLTYIDNCADAIALAGLKRGVEGEIFNVVDDDTPRSRAFLRMYKRNVGHFRSIYVPYRIFYLFCLLWEKYSKWSDGQLPPAFNRFRCSAYWKGNNYSNAKMKKLLDWRMRVSFEEGVKRYFEYMRMKAAQKQ